MTNMPPQEGSDPSNLESALAEIGVPEWADTPASGAMAFRDIFIGLSEVPFKKFIGNTLIVDFAEHPSCELVPIAMHAGSVVCRANICNSRDEPEYLYVGGSVYVPELIRQGLTAEEEGAVATTGCKCGNHTMHLLGSGQPFAVAKSVFCVSSSLFFRRAHPFGALRSSKTFLESSLDNEQPGSLVTIQTEKGRSNTLFVDANPELSPLMLGVFRKIGQDLFSVFPATNT